MEELEDAMQALLDQPEKLRALSDANITWWRDTLADLHAAFKRATA